ncbi:protein disulfide-isomerase [Geotalea uraniireducens]|uniref:Protein disulfide-isomerase n=1 Tax=Geotalea uraniireducens TaxID=351604 RepID=A0ABM8EIJ1_9BACT|nr:DsbC family protein [Geotalea uraniireducens]BDV42230.1 protein disulfide-isomerase [Geotalea uraniireducens]
MKVQWYKRVGIFLMAGALFAAVAHAETPQDSPESELKKLFPAMPVTSIKKTPVDGVYEVVTGNNVIYVHLKTGHVFVGDLYTKEGKNLTAETRNMLIADRFKLLTKADMEKALKIGNGKHTVIEITDPDCPFCRKMHEYWGRRPDVTRYVFFLPLPMHPTAEKKARYILAAKDKELAFWEVYSGELDKRPDLFDKPNDDKGLLAAQRAIVEKLGVHSTPAFWVDGNYVSGANIPLIEKIIGVCKTAPGAAPGTPATCEGEGK